MRYTLLGIVLFGISVVGYGQEISLREYRDSVVRYNQDVKLAKINAETALLGIKAAKTAFFPRIDGSGNYSYQFQDVEFFPGTSLKHDSYGVEVSAVQNVYSGRIATHAYRISQLQEAIARLGVENSIINIVYAADVAYWTTVAQRDLYHLSDEYVTIINELLAIVDIRFTGGAISRTDLLMVQARLKDAEIQRNKAYDNYLVALQTFNVLQGCAVAREYKLTESIYGTIDTLEQVELLDSVLIQRPDYLSAHRNIAIANRQVRLTKGNYLPQLAVGIRERFGTTTINLDGNSDFTTIAFAQLKVPIFYFKERRHKVRQQLLGVEQAGLNLSKLSDQIEQEINNSYTNMIQSAKRVAIVKSALQISQDNLDLNTFSYNEGKLPILDVLSAQATWLQTSTNEVMSNYEYKILEAQYTKALGNIPMMYEHYK